MGKPNNTLFDPGIELRTPCLAVAVATTTPMRQKANEYEIFSNKNLMFVLQLVGIDDKRPNHEFLRKYFVLEVKVHDQILYGKIEKRLRDRSMSFYMFFRMRA